MKPARPIWIQQSLYETSKAYLEPAKPIWIQQGLHGASKAYMDPGKAYMEEARPL